MRSFAEGLAEKAMIVERRQARFAGRVRQAERLVQAGSQIIARPAQTPEEFIIQ